MYINIALPKGRLGKKSYELLKKIGYSCKELEEENRKLVFTSEENKVRYFWVKPSDVPVYVEKGIADIGVAGVDVLLESEADVYDMLDLGFGKCYFAIAAPKGWKSGNRTLKIATKYINYSRKHFEKIERKVELIKLNGSVELAPIVGLSDAIIDIVETGATLKENNLEIVEKLEDISARVIVNKVNYKFKNETIEKVLGDMKGEL
ncbi:ATP phosphoribosyltransferase [uncultured Ilyobacter sp.]|uniref:ATP phosphoribosyltransferase n=1 Tax=uncultured Ilyobacter sp. TaxID=544433 RepID=UPI0029F4F6A3|nr:ATP phosphoribosyltransferase [uncultured Ilyobacter sp.]